MARVKVTLPSQTSLTIEEEALRMDVFWEALKDYDIEFIVEAFRETLETLKWFPRPSDIIEAIDQTLEIRHRKNAGAIEWKEFEQCRQPTDEEIQTTRNLLSRLFAKWNSEDTDAKRDRTERFEKRRTELKRQAKTMC